MMSKMILILTAVVLAAAMMPAATAEKATLGGTTGGMTGGWSVAEDQTVTEGLADLFFKALGRGMKGVSYTPVAYLGSQVVAGTNHCFLCVKQAVVAKPIPEYVLAYVYEDLQGNAQIMNFAAFDFGSFCTYGAN